MPRVVHVVECSADGSEDQVVELQRALQNMEDELTRVRHVVAELAARVQVLEQQNEAGRPRQQERDAEGVVRVGFRVCRNSSGREFRVHRNHPNEQFCCSNCRKGLGHSDRCVDRSRLCGGAATETPVPEFP